MRGTVETTGRFPTCSDRPEREPPSTRAAAAGRPDACTLCYVEADRAWAVRQAARLWPGRSGASADAPPEPDHGAPRDALFGGDPIARAAAAEALGRAPSPVPFSVASLLEAMARDRYPSVRHLAARALGRVLAVDQPRAAAATRWFDATGDAVGRARILREIEQALTGPPLPPLDAAGLALLRGEATRADIDIGE